MGEILALLLAAAAIALAFGIYVRWTRVFDRRTHNYGILDANAGYDRQEFDKLARQRLKEELASAGLAIIGIVICLAIAAYFLIQSK